MHKKGFANLFSATNANNYLATNTKPTGHMHFEDLNLPQRLTKKLLHSIRWTTADSNYSNSPNYGEWHSRKINIGSM